MFAHTAGDRATPVLTVVSEADASARGAAVDRLERGVAAARTIGFGTLAATVAALTHAGVAGFGF